MELVRRHAWQHLQDGCPRKDTQRPELSCLPLCSVIQSVRTICQHEMRICNWCVPDSAAAATSRFLACCVQQPGVFIDSVLHIASTQSPCSAFLASILKFEAGVMSVPLHTLPNSVRGRCPQAQALTIVWQVTDILSGTVLAGAPPLHSTTEAPTRWTLWAQPSAPM